MGFFDIFFGQFNPSAKIYRSNIEKIPSSEFNRRVRLKINNKEEYLSGQSLRDYLAGLAGGGVSLRSMEEKLKKAGLADKQYNLRQEIISTIKEYYKKK